MQIGSRSSITGADAENPVHLQLLTQCDSRASSRPARHRDRLLVVGLGRRQPRHDAAHRSQPDAGQKIFYAVGYGGNGVSFSTRAGKRLAERMAGKDAAASIFELPIYDSPLPGHWAAPFRRIGQAMLYRWYYLRDEIL